jgi:hypothetical protein
LLPPDQKNVAHGIDYDYWYFAYKKASNSKNVKREAMFISAIADGASELSELFP